MKKLLLLLIIFLVYETSFGQIANIPPVGPSTNLCPKQKIRYTSAANLDGGRCDAIGGWDVINGDIIDNGVGTNNSVWVDVEWDNKPTGSVGNSCGVLNVTINSIVQPSLAETPSVSLCGSSSLVLNANVSSMNNVVGFTWNIVGTGITPTGMINTTLPQLTINYSNWVAGTPFSATVAVGARNSCGFTTPTSPLTTQNPLPGITIPAIARSAWVQLSPGNINDLMAASVNSAIICTTRTLSVSNRPPSANVAWSSSNTAALTIDPVTGFATRVNNFNWRCCCACKVI
jgi:hypothetical protein